MGIQFDVKQRLPESLGHVCVGPAVRNARPMPVVATQIPKKPVREKLTTEEGAAAARLSKKLVKLQTQMDLPPLR